MADKTIRELEQLDALTDETLVPVWDPIAPGTALAITGKQLKKAIGADGLSNLDIDMKTARAVDATGGETDLVRQSCVVLPLSKTDGADGVEIRSVSIKTSGNETVKFGVYALTDNGNGTGTLACISVLGEVRAVNNLASLEGLKYYTNVERPYLMAFSKTAILSCVELRGLVSTDAPYFDDANLYENGLGSTIGCRLDQWSNPFFACAAVNWASVTKQTVSEFAEDANTRLDALERKEDSPGGVGATVTAVDLSRYDGEGIILETYSDGSTITYSMEFDAEGNPTKITDSNGNETVLTW